MARRKMLSVALLVTAVLATSLTTAGCGRRVPGGAEIGIPGNEPSSPGYQDPNSQNPGYNDPGYGNPGYGNPGYNDPGYGVPAIPNGQPNPQMGTFKVDQDLLNQWQARGIAASGGSIYVSASDKSNILKKGTVIKMDASSGKNWKDLGKSFLGLVHKLDDSIQGVAITGSGLLVVDSQKGMYTMKSSGGDIKQVKGSSGGFDVASGGSSVYVSNGGTVERTDSSGSSRTPIPGVSSTGGIGADMRGTAYVINGNRITAIDPMGQPRDVVMQGLGAPVDVAADGRTGSIYVLEQTGIKRFSASGQLVSQFPHGAKQATSIAVDESGNVFVADFGSSHKDSQIIKFGPSNDQMAANPGGGYGNPYSPTPGYGNDPYGNGGYGNGNGNCGGGYGNGGYNPNCAGGNTGYGGYNANPYGQPY